jgi:hypothetical protein
MNKLEEAYAWYLENLKRGGDILYWEFEGIKLKLGNGAWYTPDFMVVKRILLSALVTGSPIDTKPYYQHNTTDRIEFHEVKGFMREAANVRIKVAASKFTMMDFVIVRRTQTGIWQFTQVKP